MGSLRTWRARKPATRACRGALRRCGRRAPVALPCSPVAAPNDLKSIRQGREQMAAKENVEIMRGIFRAIEARDLARLVALTDPAAEFHWPPSLPYGGISALQPAAGPSRAATWIPLAAHKTQQR